MSDIKLFRINASPPIELTSRSVALEKSLQLLIESHLETFLGVRFLASEYSTGKVHGGRIDTLGIDENGCPVIIEYKRSTNQNVINQGLFYLDWLMDHQGEFELFVLKKLGQEVADGIEWSSPRLICIAGDFTRYDGHAVQQIPRNIELVRYRKFGDELLLFELVNGVRTAVRDVEVPAAPSEPAPPAASSGGRPSPVAKADSAPHRTVAEQLASASPELSDLYAAVAAYLQGLGDDVEEARLKRYIAFRRLKNFACVVPFAYSNQLVIYAKVDPSTVSTEAGFTRDVSQIGHWGTGDVEITLRTMDDFEKAKTLLLRSYEAS